MELPAVTGLPQLLLLMLMALRLSARDCPCSDAALCRPIRHRPDFEVSTPSAPRSGRKISRGAHSSVNHPSLPLFGFPSEETGTLGAGVGRFPRPRPESASAPASRFSQGWLLSPPAQPPAARVGDPVLLTFYSCCELVLSLRSGTKTSI